MLDQPRYCGFCGGALRFSHGNNVPACVACGKHSYLDPKLAVACIIVMERRLLLVKRAIQPKLGEWSFPSGYVDRGEKVEVAAEREVFEETRLHVRSNWLVGLFSERDRAVVLAVYDATPDGGEVEAADETEEVGLFPLDGLPKLAFEHDGRILRAWQAERRRRGLFAI